MSRAAMRRLRREKQKSETVTYNLTKEQLDIMVNNAMRDKIAKVKEEVTYDSINTAMTLLLVLPMEVLMDHYWQKSYEKRIPEFTEYVLQYYDQWLKGEKDMGQMKEDLWKYAGVRLEESEDRVI